MYFFLWRILWAFLTSPSNPPIPYPSMDGGLTFTLAHASLSVASARYHVRKIRSPGQIQSDRVFRIALVVRPGVWCLAPLGCWVGEWVGG